MFGLQGSKELFSNVEKGQLEQFLHGLHRDPLSSAMHSSTAATATTAVSTYHTTHGDDPLYDPSIPSLYSTSSLSSASSSSTSSSEVTTPKNKTAKAKGTGRGRKPPQELLSDEQKKANHIASEQKRRANIRIGFDQLVDIVPTLNNGNRSEALILQQSYEYIRQLVDTKSNLKNRIRDLQTSLGDELDEDSSDEDIAYAF